MSNTTGVWLAGVWLAGHVKLVRDTRAAVKNTPPEACEIERTGGGAHTFGVKNTPVKGNARGTTASAVDMDGGTGACVERPDA